MKIVIKCIFCGGKIDNPTMDRGYCSKKCLNKFHYKKIQVKMITNPEFKKKQLNYYNVYQKERYRNDERYRKKKLEEITKWRKKNRDKVKGYDKKYYNKNKEKILQKNREYYERNKEKIKKMKQKSCHTKIHGGNQHRNV